MSVKQSKSTPSSKKVVPTKGTKAAAKKAEPESKPVAKKAAVAAVEEKPKTTTKKAAVEKVVAEEKPAKKTVAKKTVAKKAAPKKAAPKKVAKKTVTKKEEKEDEEGEEGVEGSKTRFFKVVIGDVEAPHGRFSGSKPKQAANKALTSIFKSKEQSGGSLTGKVKFSIVECTRGSKHKKYHYVGERVKLKEPMKVTIGKGDTAKVIEYKFNNRVMKDKTVSA